MRNITQKDTCELLQTLNEPCLTDVLTHLNKHEGIAPSVKNHFKDRDEFKNYHLSIGLHPSDLVSIMKSGIKDGSLFLFKDGEILEFHKEGV